MAKDVRCVGVDANTIANIRLKLEAEIEGLVGRVDDLERLFFRALGEHRHDALEKRLAKLEARLASKPDDFGGVTSTGALKTMTRWVIVADNNMVFSRWAGMVSCSPDVEPTFFDDARSAQIVLCALFRTCPWVKVRRVDVIERDGRLIEARYA